MKPLKKIKKAVIGAVSSALAAPKTYKANRAIKQADRDVATIKKARAYDSSTSDDAVRARTAAYIVKKRITKKK